MLLIIFGHIKGTKHCFGRSRIGKVYAAITIIALSKKRSAEGFRRWMLMDGLLNRGLILG